jgi:hypothetical protein
VPVLLVSCLLKLSMLVVRPVPIFVTPHKKQLMAPSGHHGMITVTIAGVRSLHRSDRGQRYAGFPRTIDQ